MREKYETKMLLNNCIDVHCTGTATSACKAQNGSRWRQKEFGINPEKAKGDFPKEAGDDACSSNPTRRRPGNLPSLEVETDLCYEL